MNPILLKPSADATSQVVVHGMVWRNLSPQEYSRHYDMLLAKVCESYEHLAAHGRAEGIRHDRCSGAYLHGARESPDVVEDWIGYRPPQAPDRAKVCDRLADWFDRWADRPMFDRLFLT